MNMKDIVMKFIVITLLLLLFMVTILLQFVIDLHELRRGYQCRIELSMSGFAVTFCTRTRPDPSEWLPPLTKKRKQI